MARRRLIREHNQEHDSNTSFPFEKGEMLLCVHTETGENITGKFNIISKNGDKILVKNRWITLSDYVITRVV